MDIQITTPCDSPPTLSRQTQVKAGFFTRLASYIGSFLIACAVAVPLLFYGPLLQVEIGYRLRQLLRPTDSRASYDPYTSIVGKVPDQNFSLFIPKIDAVGKIIANVSTSNREEYFNILKEGIAHAKGTVLPGTIGNIYLFAHSTDSPLNIIRYNAVFYLLRELEVGDEAFVVYGGKPYRYVVREKKIVDPTDVTYLVAENEENIEQLVLQTCWPPGTTQKRLLIFAQRSDEQQALRP